MALLIIGSWSLSDGLNGIVVDHTSPYLHFSETKAAQEITDGIMELFFGALCFVLFIILFFTKRNFLFPLTRKS
jgi:predicted permease